MKFKPYQPPAKKSIKCTDAITRCKYSAKKIIKSIEPLYSTWYPATTSDSVSAWSNGVLFDSNRKMTIKLDATGPYSTINQNELWAKTKSWKLTDWELNASKEYTIVINISNDMTWTKALAVAIIA